jgi:hypothetical protein
VSGLRGMTPREFVRHLYSNLEILIFTQPSSPTPNTHHYSSSPKPSSPTPNAVPRL